MTSSDITSSDTQEGQEQVDTAEGQQQADTAEGVAGSDSDEGVIDPIPKKKAKRQRREPGQSLETLKTPKGIKDKFLRSYKVNFDVRVHSYRMYIWIEQLF